MPIKGQLLMIIKKSIKPASSQEASNGPITHGYHKAHKYLHHTKQDAINWPVTHDIHKAHKSCIIRSRMDANNGPITHENKKKRMPCSAVEYVIRQIGIDSASPLVERMINYNRTPCSRVEPGLHLVSRGGGEDL